MIEKLQVIRRVLRALDLDEIEQPCILILSCSSGRERASVFSVRSEDMANAWTKLEESFLELPLVKSNECEDLIVEKVTKITALTLQSFQNKLLQTKSNHFANGLSLDPNFSRFFLSSELNGNAILYGGSHLESATLCVENLMRYGREKYGQDFDFENNVDMNVYIFETVAVYCGKDNRAYQLQAKGPLLGSRVVNYDQNQILELIKTTSDFLARQVDDQGLFLYEVYPCFNQNAPLYSMTHHALTVFSMFESWPFTRSDCLWSSAQLAMTHVVDNGLFEVELSDSSRATFLVDNGSETRLGGNALVLLGLLAFTEISGDRSYTDLMGKLARGVLAMLNPVTLQFVQVLSFPDLSPKEWARSHHDEVLAGLALIRFYKFDRRSQWLQTAEALVDHWEVNSPQHLTSPWFGRYIEGLMVFRPRARYERLMTSLQNQQPESRFSLAKLSIGFIWPEQAMYFARPDLVVGGSMNRDRAFRIKINEVALKLLDMIWLHVQQRVDRVHTT